SLQRRRARALEIKPRREGPKASGLIGGTAIELSFSLSSCLLLGVRARSQSVSLERRFHAASPGASLEKQLSQWSKRTHDLLPRIHPKQFLDLCRGFDLTNRV